MINSFPLVSVVIPTYNRSAFILKAIASVLNQKLSPYDVIVIDDGSTDDTRIKLAAYQNRIKYIYQSNSGVSAARNAGIIAAKGEWVAFLDSDDEWAENYLSEQIRYIQTYPNVVMQTGNCLFIDAQGNKRSYFEINGSLKEFKNREYFVLDAPFPFVLLHGPWQVGSTIVKKEALIKAGLFDVRLKISEDYDLMARIALQGPVGLLNKNLVTIYRRDEAIDCLTSLSRNFPFESRVTYETIYNKLLTLVESRRDYRKVLYRLMGENRRAMGNLLIENGNITEAKDSFKRAFRLNPSLVSALKLAMSYLPRLLREALVKSYHKFKTN